MKPTKLIRQEERVSQLQVAYERVRDTIYMAGYEYHTPTSELEQLLNKVSHALSEAKTELIRLQDSWQFVLESMKPELEGGKS